MFKPWMTICLLTLASSLVSAGPVGLKSARIEELAGEVSYHKAGSAAAEKAQVKTVVTGKDIVHTGKKSRAELEFEDQSLCRLGSNTIFSFDPETRDMAFTRGVALVHVPPGKGGARIATPAATAAIQGDTLVVRATVMADGTPATQFTALSPKGGPTDGNIVITLNNNPNASFQLAPGNIAIVPQNATSVDQIPRVEIDVSTFAAKSPLLQDLPDTAKVEMNMVQVEQQQAFTSGAAVRTDLAIVNDRVVKADGNGNFTPPPVNKPNPQGTATPPSVQDFAGSMPDQPPPLFDAHPNFFAGTDFPKDVLPGNFQLPPPTLDTLARSFTSVNPLTFSSVTFDTALGTINGSHSSPSTFEFGWNESVGRFYVDTLTLSGGTITVQGGKALEIFSSNNSAAGAPINITGNTTFTFSGATPKSVTLQVDGQGGNAQISGGTTVTANGTDLNIHTIPGGPAAGNVTMGAASKIAVNAGSVAEDAGSIVLTGKAVTVAGLEAKGIDNAGGNATHGGAIIVNSVNTTTINGTINAQGGSSSGSNGNGGDAGFTALSGDNIALGGSALINSNGGSGNGSGTGGTGGTVLIVAPNTSLTTVAANDISVNGGTGNQGGAGGNISIFVKDLTTPAGSQLSAAGGPGGGPGGDGGSILVHASGTTGISITSSGTTSINAAGGSGAPPLDGIVVLQAPNGAVTLSGSTPAAVSAGPSGEVHIDSPSITAPAGSTDPYPPQTP